VITKHFFKILAIFTAMIVLGLLSFYILNNSEENTGQPINPNPQTQVAK